jgi:hypothetical protein
VRRTWEEELRFDDDVVRAGEMGLQAEYADQTPECVHPCSDIQRDLIACRERIILYECPRKSISSVIAKGEHFYALSVIISIHP